MNIAKLIEKKLMNQELSEAEIRFVVQGYSSDQISEEEMAKLVKAYAQTEMTEKETIDFFECTYDLAKKINLKTITGFKIDKHSTGGVGDKVTLVLLPILEAIGLKIYKLSGGRLGFTGGTLEKLSAFPGIKIRLNVNSFLKKAKQKNLIVAGIGEDLSRFEEKLYSLRSRLHLVHVVGMIVNSIMIKKIILGNDGLVVGVNVGSGSLFSSYAKAKTFANLAMKIAKKHNRKFVAVFNDMNEPLGKTIGNKLEIIEAIDALKGKAESDLWEIVVGLATEALLMSGKIEKANQAINLITRTIESGKAFDCFRKWIVNFGGDFDAVYQNPEPDTKYQIEIKAWKDGFIKIKSAKQIGQIANELNWVDDQVDYQAGLVFAAKTGKKVKKDDLIVTIFTNRQDHSHFEEKLKKSIGIQEKETKLKGSKILKILKGY